MTTMRIQDSRGCEIKSLSDWAKLYNTPQTSHQWKEGRSAYSAAEFIINRDGGKVIQNWVEEAICKNIVIERVVPEYEVRFDKFGRTEIGEEIGDRPRFLRNSKQKSTYLYLDQFRNYLKKRSKTKFGSIIIPLLAIVKQQKL